jgi:hypothetical protein
MGLQHFYAKGPHRLLRAASRAARRQIAENDTSNSPNYCAIIVHT